MERNSSGFRNDDDPSSTPSGGSGTPGPPPRDGRSRDDMDLEFLELRLPPRDERIPSEFWRQQERQVSAVGRAEGSPLHADGENEQAGRWQQDAAADDDADYDDAGGDVERIGQAVGGSGWGSGGASSYVNKNDTGQSSSGWGAAWREAVANGTAVASTASTFNGGWGAPCRGGNDVGGGVTSRKIDNGASDTATAAAAASSDSNVIMAKDDDGIPVDSDVQAPPTRSAPKLGKLFQFNAKISEMPCQCLEAWFSRTKVGRGVPKTCYSTWNIDPGTPHEPKWVSIFTSPVNGECFMCGQWKGSPKGYKEIEVAAVDGSKILIPYYSKKVNAEHAAAGRALDCLSYRETNGEESYSYCFDEPYVSIESAPPLPVSAPDGVADAAVGSNTSGAHHSPAASLVTLPKAMLQQWYMERFADFDQNAKFGDYFECRPNGDEMHKMWTCAFTELVSGTERFVCGRWGNGSTPKYEVIPERSSDMSSEAEVDVVWYTTKKNAEHAAAARALDCLRVRENRNDGSPRLCLDVPYLSDDAPPLPLAVTASLELSDPLPTLAIPKLPTALPMDTEEQIQHRQEHRSSRTQASETPRR